MPLDFQVESYSTIRAEVEPLLQQHYEEIALFKDKVKLSPDVDKYLAQEKAGILCVITARKDGKLVGYHASFLIRHLHYDMLIALTDIFFISKEYRNGTAGIRLFQFFEQEMRRRGVKEIVAGCKVKHDLSRMFEYLNWIPTDKMFAKWIGD